MTEQIPRSMWRLLLTAVLLAGLATASANSQPQSTVEKPTSPIPRGGCVTAECHPDVKAMPFLHGPIGVDACDACHQELDATAHTFQPSRPGKEMCAFCHQLEMEGEYVHKPVAEGDCAQCHNPHGGEDRFLLRGGAGAASCAQCHADVTAGMPEVHGPVAAGACTACHRPHSAANPKLLSSTGRDLCLGCHASLQKRLETVRIVHGPVAVECTACHRSHAAEKKMLLKQDAPELCWSCHAAIQERVEKATIKHEAVLTKGACRNCHTPHGSDFAALLQDDMVDGCLACHDREIELPDGSVLPSTKAVLAAGKNWHGPIAQRNCVACHQVHGGSIFRLLVQEYPAEFYSPFKEENYALCFACHNREIVFNPNTTELTNFRNGDQNLHFLHVNKKIKGRTCRACHETHASNNPKHVRDEVPFGSGGWMLPIGFVKTETGGRCNSGCHRPYAYDRVNPVALELGQQPGTESASASAPVEPEVGRQGGTQP